MIDMPGLTERSGEVTAVDAARAQSDSGMRPRPVLRIFIPVALAVGWIALSIPLLTGLPAEPFVLGTLVLGLVVPSLIVLRIEKRGQVAALFRDLIRLPRPRLLLVPAFLAIPSATLGAAAIAGAAVVPSGAELAGVAVQLITGLVLVNLLEELVWMGFVQRRLAGRSGPIRAALLTAVLFAGLHLPLGLAGWSQGPAMVIAGVAALFIAGVALRLVIGAVDTLGRSLLAAAAVHASFNAAGAFVDPGSDWIRYAVTGAFALIAVAWLYRTAPKSHTLDM